jgi:hypothetical protein
VDGDNLFIDAKMLQNWAGPDHWKYCAPKPTTGEGGDRPKHTRKKDAFFINFHDSTDITSEALFASGILVHCCMVAAVGMSSLSSTRQVTANNTFGAGTEEGCTNHEHSTP